MAIRFPKKHLGRFVCGSFVILTILLFFQNCGKSFVSRQVASSSSLASTNDGGVACSFNNQSIASGASVSAFSASSVSYGTNCSSVATKVSCANGVLTPANAFGSCAPEAPASCNFNGQTILSGGSIKAYQSGMVASGSTCVSQNRVCTNGTLDGSYTFGNCAVGAPATCTFAGTTMPSGSTKSGYTASIVAFDKTCASVATTVTCTNGALSPATVYPSCSVRPALSCNFNGSNLSSGSTASGFTSATVPYGSFCPSVATNVSCTNGTLNPSNAYSTCTPLPNPIRFTSIPQGLPNYSGLPSNTVLSSAVSGSNFYVGTDGGLAISSDGGKTWVTRTTANGLASNRVEKVGLSGNKIFTATEYGGVSVSTDGGQTFIVRTDFGYWALALFTSGQNVLVGTSTGLFLSTDGGVTFTKKTTADGLANDRIQSVFAEGSKIYVGTFAGLSISTNAGQSFTSTKTDGLDSPVIMAIAASSSNVYVLARQPVGSLFIAASVDGGQSFSISTDINTGQYSDGSLIASGSTFYIGGDNGLWKSSDAGKTATQVIKSAYINGLSSSGSTIYVATYKQGLLSSADGFATTVGLTDKNAFESNNILSLYTFGSSIYVGVQDGLYVSTNGGATFIRKISDPKGIFSIYASGTSVYAGGNNALYVSVDSGSTFMNKLNTPNQYGIVTHMINFGIITKISGSGSSVYFTDEQIYGLMVSNDNGQTFTRKTTTDGLINDRLTTIYASDKAVYVGSGIGISISTDGGKSFTSRAMTNDPTDGWWGNWVTSIFATDSVLYVGRTDGLYISTDGGQSFVTKNFSSSVYDSSYVTSVFVSGSTLYVGRGFQSSTGGLATSNDGGKTFTMKTTSSGLSLDSVNQISVSGGTVFLGSFNGLSRSN